MEIKALVVDNNPVLLRAVSAILSQEGCIVQTAGTGLEALEIVDDFCPDIVFTDLIMPMVSGEQLCRILRNTKKHEALFIVVISAIIIEDRERILREVQYDMCIAKGNLHEMRQHIQEALRAYGTRNTSLSGEDRKTAYISDRLKPSCMTSELLSEKHHLTDILANLGEGIIELNYQGKVVTANSSALKILSCEEENIVGIPLSEIVDWGKFSTAIRQWTDQQLISLGMGKYDIFEDAPLLLDKRIITASFMPISEADSVFGLCILRDISRQFKAEKHHKELDNALRLVKKMDAMSCMAGGLAHDFNNLLTVICGNLDIVTFLGEKQSSDERKTLLNQAKKAALVAVDLTRQISCFSNFGLVTRENVKVEQLVRKTVGHFFRWENNKYKVKVASNDGLVSADPEELSQAIDNVLQNAVEASSGQKLEVIIDQNEFDTPHLMSGQYVPAGKYIRIDICDLGRGINSEQLFRVFDPYYSTKQRGKLKGMGLGLTVVYAIVRNHGGYVVVSSSTNQGTTVSLYLPAIQEDKTVYPAQESVAIADRFALLIEPELQMGEMGKIMLGYLGFTVKMVGDRAGAIHELKKNTDDLQFPRPIVLLSLSNINGESAIETCRLLHEIDPDLQVIAMSGSLLDPVMENCRQYGFINTLPKPFSIDNLKHVINTVLNT